MFSLQLFDFIFSHIAVTTQDFPDRGRQSLSLGQNLLFPTIFAENCMNMKEIGPRGRRECIYIVLCYADC